MLEQYPETGRKRVPLWHRIEGVLRHKIATGEYKVGNALPSEPTLAAAFGVNRLTVREALRTLTAEGIIRQIQGKGTFVLRQPNELGGAGLITGWVGEVGFNDAFPTLSPDPQHQVPRCSLVDMMAVDAPAEIKDVLRLEEEDVIRVERILTSRGEPFCYVLDYLPRSIGDRIAREDVEGAWLTKLLSDKLGIRPMEARQSIHATLADTVLGDKLRVPFGAPLLYSERVYYGPAGQPLYVAKLWYRADRFRYAATFRFQGGDGSEAIEEHFSAKLC